VTERGRFECSLNDLSEKKSAAYTKDVSFINLDENTEVADLSAG
jgi:hypothetical protein